MFETIFKNIDKQLREDSGCSTELEYVEQTSWILFLKYLDDFEQDRQNAAKLNNQNYEKLFKNEFKWDNWAAPKNKNGKIDYNTALTGDDLKNFVDQKLFPYLASFKNISEDPKTINYKIGEIFSEIKNKLQSGYILREIINKVDELHFLGNENKHELSSLYEDKIRNMGNAGRNGGEYYTPRPLIKIIIQLINPKIGELIYDGAAGSGGFLCESYTYLIQNNKLSASDYEFLQNKTLYGKEKKSLPYITGIMNMILHGIEAPNYLHTNTLAESLSDIQAKDKYDIVLANPPFGGNERAELLQNFPIKTSETAYLFLQHFMKILKDNGRAAIIIKNTFLESVDSPSLISLRKELIEEFNLHSILILPRGVFTGAGVETVVLFFNKGNKTKKIWNYELNLERSLGKRNPLNSNDLSEFFNMFNEKKEGPNSWFVSYEELNKSNYDLKPRNPNKKEIIDNRTSLDILNEINEINLSTSKTLEELKKLI